MLVSLRQQRFLTSPRLLFLVAVITFLVALQYYFGRALDPHVGESMVLLPMLPAKISDGALVIGPSALLASSLTDPNSGRPQWVEYVAPSAGESDSPWTSIQCLAWHRNRSCAFDQIYYDSQLGNFVIALPDGELGNIKKAPYDGKALMFDSATDYDRHLDTGVAVTEDSLRELMKGATTDAKDRDEVPRFQPCIQFFKDKSEFAKWHREKQGFFFSWLRRGDTKPELIDGVTLQLLIFGPMNPGHFLYDSLYPAWITAVRFGYAFWPMNILPVDEGETKAARETPHWSVLKHFGRGQVFLTSELEAASVYSFSRLLVGSRFMGHRNPQRSMAMPGSYSYENAFFLFGQRLLAGFDFVPWPTEMLELERGLSSWGCQGVIVDNKRFDDELKAMLMDIAAKSEALFGCDITFLRWEDYSFQEQLAVIASSNLYISSTGTGMTRCHLIRPGGVVVHLGTMERLGHPERYQSAYRDVHFATGSPHLNSVYYPRRLWNTYGRLQREGVIDAIQRGVELFMKPVKMPRPYSEGLSPTSLSWERYCNSTTDNCRAVVEVQNGNFQAGEHRAKDTYMCEYCSWVDFFNLAPMWSPVGCRDGDTIVHCPLDHRLYASVMDSDHVAFDPQCYDAEVAKIRSAKESLLRKAAAKLKPDLDYKNLTASEAVAAMLQVKPPNCPLRVPAIPPQCAC